MPELDRFLARAARRHNLDDLLRARSRMAFVCASCAAQQDSQLDTCTNCRQPYLLPAETLILYHFRRTR